MRSQENGSGQANTGCSNSGAPKRNHFYVLRCRAEQEKYPDVVTGILQVLSIDVYALLDPSSTLSFVNFL